MRVYKASFIVAICSLCSVMGPDALADIPDHLNCDVSVDFKPVKTGANTYILGTMEQQCDAARGYKVFAEGGESLAGAIMHVSGRSVMFDQTGRAVLVETTEPGMGQDILVLITRGAQPNTLSFTIEANT